MREPENPDRNPLIIPDSPRPSAQRRGCPKCGEADYGGQLVYGVATFTCRKCGNQWQGGIGQEAQDPRVPHPPTNPRDTPTVDFTMTKGSDKPQPFVARRPDLTPEFRKGLPIPGEDDGGDW